MIIIEPAAGTAGSIVEILCVTTTREFPRGNVYNIVVFVNNKNTSPTIFLNTIE